MVRILRGYWGRRKSVDTRKVQQMAVAACDLGIRNFSWTLVLSVDDMKNFISSNVKDEIRPRRI
jgi:hypothetical protein